MAGAGYKLFNTGDVLTAAQVNTYLQEQAVMRFATTAARTTALSGVLAEGMVSYIDATDTLEFYNGTAWVAVNTTAGDITGITTGATSGLTGGVTSGTADLKLNTSAKGGLLVGTGSGTASELTVGANNTVLTADSTTATGLKWATPAASGGLTLISTSTLSGATSISFTSIDTSYKQLFLVFSEIYQSAENVYWSVRLNNDSTSGNYYYRTCYILNSQVASVYGGTSSTAFGADPYDAPIPTTRADDFPAQKGYGVFTINGSDLTGAKTVNWSTSGYRPGSAQQIKNFGDGIYVGTSAVSRIDLIRSSTQSITGKIHLYGVK